MGLRLHLERDGEIVAVGAGVEVSGTEITFTVGIYGRFYEYTNFYDFWECFFYCLKLGNITHYPSQKLIVFNKDLKLHQIFNL